MNWLIALPCFKIKYLHTLCVCIHVRMHYIKSVCTTVAHNICYGHCIISLHIEDICNI